MRFLCLIILVSIHLSADSQAELENLLVQVRDSHTLSPEDKDLLKQIMVKARKEEQLSALEDNLVYYALKAVNAKALKFASPVHSGWVIYKHFSLDGFALAVKSPGDEGLVHEFMKLDDRSDLPYFVWDSSRISFYLERGEAPNRDLVEFSPAIGEFQTIVESPFDDYSPIPGPSGRWLAFLSTRDRLDRQDSDASLYLKQLSKEGPSYKLTYQAKLGANTHSHPSRIIFRDSDHLELHSKSGIETLNIPKVLDQIQQNKAAFARTMMSENNSLERKSPETTPSEHIVLREHQTSFGKIQLSQSPEYFELSFSPKKAGKKIQLARWTAGQYKARKGTLVLVEGSTCFFQKNTGSGTELWGYETQSEKLRRVSPKGESCYGLTHHPDLDLLAYILERGTYRYLILKHRDSGETLGRIRVGQTSQTPDTTLLRIESENRVFYRDVQEQWMGVELKNKKADTLVASSANPQPTYDAPYQIPLADLLKKPPKEPEHKTHQKTFWLDEKIEREILAFPGYIQGIESWDQMQKLIHHFNQLRSQVALRLKKTSQSQDHALLRKSRRWKYQLNGIRELMNGAKILLEEE